MTVFDEEHTGCPIEVIMEDMANKINDNMLSDCKVKIREIVAIINFSTELIENIPWKIGHEKTIGEIGATFDDGCDNFEAMFDYAHNRNEFLWCYRIVDEMWLHH